MTRPETLADLGDEDRYESLGEINVELISTNPALLKAYAALIEAIAKQGGRVHTDSWYRQRAKLSLAKTPKQLDEQLETDQRRWDEADALWHTAMARDPADTEIKEYQRSSISAWAVKNGRPDPYDPLAAHIVEEVSV